MLVFRPIAAVLLSPLLAFYLCAIPSVVVAEQPSDTVSDGPISVVLPPLWSLSAGHPKIPGLVFLALQRESRDGFPNVNLLRAPGEVRGQTPSELTEEMLSSYRLSGFIEPRLVDLWTFEHAALRSTDRELLGRLIEYRNGEALMQSLVIIFPYPDRHYLLTVTATSASSASEIRSLAQEVLQGIDFTVLPSQEAQGGSRFGWLLALALVPLLALVGNIIRDPYRWAYRNFTNRAHPR
jgi:hypothetical protein